MITDEKILELARLIKSKFAYDIPTEKEIASEISNWLEENKIVDHQEWLRHEKDRHIKGSKGFYADKLLW